MRPLKEAFINKKNINNIKVGQDEIDWSKKIYGLVVLDQDLYNFVEKNLPCELYWMESHDEEEGIFLMNKSGIDKAVNYVKKTLGYPSGAATVYSFDKMLKSKNDATRFFERKDFDFEKDLEKYILYFI